MAPAAVEAAAASFGAASAGAGDAGALLPCRAVQLCVAELRTAGLLVASGRAAYREGSQLLVHCRQAASLRQLLEASCRGRPKPRHAGDADSGYAGCSQHIAAAAICFRFVCCSARSDMRDLVPALL